MQNYTNNSTLGSVNGSNILSGTTKNENMDKGSSVWKLNAKM